MILQSLTEFSRREGLVQDAAFEYAGVAWAIEIGRDGTFWELRDLRTEGSGKKKKLFSRQMLIPRRSTASKPTSGDDEGFLVHKTEYVLGLADADLGRRTRRRELFAEGVRKVADATSAPQLRAVLRFLTDSVEREKCQAELEKAAHSDGDLFCFLIDGLLVHELEEVKAYWKNLVPPGSDLRCLVCGRISRPARLHPDVRGLAGAPKPVPVVSFNKPAFWSYGWEYAQNASVCEECAVAYTTALNRCLSAQFPDPKDPESHLTRQAYTLTENLTAVYWSDDSSSGVERLAAAAISDPDQARALLAAPYHGGVTSLPLRFHCLLLQGSKGRATVRSYQSELIPRVRQNLQNWFAQIAVRSDRTLTLQEILASLAIQRKSMKLPPNLAGELYLAILFGREIPRPAVQLAVSRNRAEADVSSGRAALLQAWLVRKTQLNERKLLVKLDPECASIGYQLGRLLAVCEQIQYKASDGKVNKSISDRFFPALSSRPVFVFSSLIRLSEVRLSQIRRRTDSTYLKGTVGEILNRISCCELPAQLTLAEQANFALGYYHQRRANFPEPISHSPSNDEDAVGSSYSSY